MWMSYVISRPAFLYLSIICRKNYCMGSHESSSVDTYVVIGQTRYHITLRRNRGNAYKKDTTARADRGLERQVWKYGRGRWQPFAVTKPRRGNPGRERRTGPAIREQNHSRLRARSSREWWDHLRDVRARPHRQFVQRLLVEEVTLPLGRREVRSGELPGRCAGGVPQRVWEPAEAGVDLRTISRCSDRAHAG